MPHKLYSFDSYPLRGVIRLDNSQIENSIGQIRKRNGSVDPFYKEKISSAIFKALAATSEPDRNLAYDLAEGVVTRLVEHGFSASRPPSVEDIQDLVRVKLNCVACIEYFLQELD